MVTSLSEYPSKVNTNFVTPDFTDKENVPSFLVDVAVPLGLVATVTAANGEPSFASVTFPVTVLFCAFAAIADKHSNIPSK